MFPFANVAVADEIEEEQPIISVEGDKAAMEVPSPYKGKVTEIKVATGDSVGTGTPLLVMEFTELPTAAKPSAPAAAPALGQAPKPDTPLGIYVHIPFCRKRCHFCYFRVYTDKNSSEIRNYIDAVLDEMQLYAKEVFVGGRKPNFVYFGGGTPSYLSEDQLRHLTDGMKELLPWDEAEEVTFECEPGTLREKKLEVLREIAARVAVARRDGREPSLSPELRRRAVRAPLPRRAGAAAGDDWAAAGDGRAAAGDVRAAAGDGRAAAGDGR